MSDTNIWLLMFAICGWTLWGFEFIRSNGLQDTLDERKKEHR